MEAGKNANYLQHYRPTAASTQGCAGCHHSTRHLTSADKIFKQPYTKAPLCYFIGDKTVRVRSMAEASEW